MSKSESLQIGAAYIRVSTDDQTELSPDAQLRVIREAAKSDGFLIPNDFTFIEQKGISGRRAENRPEFQRMIAIAKSQTPAPFCRLYLWKFSRFARNQEESTFYKGILRKKCGVEIKSVSEPIMEGMFGRLIETIIEWFDEYYSINLSGEVIRGMTEKALRHGYQTSPCLGYGAVGDGQPFVIKNNEMDIVEQIFQKYHDGKDMTAIARELNQAGARSKRGNKFDRRGIYRILTNPFYIGTVNWSGYSFQGTHELRPSVVELYNATQKRISSEYRPKQRREISGCRHWLSGLLQCGYCGASLSFNRTNNSKKRPDFFQCWKYGKGIHPESCSIAVNKAEKAVMDSLRQVLRSGAVEYEYIPRSPSALDNDESRLLREALERISIKETRVREAYENGIDTIEEYRDNKSRLLEERKRLQNQLEALEKQFSSCEPIRPSADEILGRIRDVLNLLSDPDVDFTTKGNAIRSIVKKIVYDREHNRLCVFYYLKEQPEMTEIPDKH